MSAHASPTPQPFSNETRRPIFARFCASALLAVGIASAAMAEDALPEIPLNSGSVALPAADALLIRTAMTPSSVNISLPIGMANTVCAEYAQVPRTGQNGMQCGYDRLVHRVCREAPRQCHIDERSQREICAPARRDCYNEFIDVARVCTWLETECVRTEIAQSTQLRSVKLKFKGVAKLAAGETETYELHGAQTRLDGTDARFSLASISTKRAVKIKAKDGLFTGFNDVITIKGD